MGTLNRRRFISTASAAAGAATLAGCANAEDSAKPAGAPADTGNEAAQAAEVGESAALKEAIVPFDGTHQAGISTPTQATAQLIGFDLQGGVGKQGFANLMKLWSADARKLCTGEAPLGTLEPEMLAAPSNLTITCGLGEPVFDLLEVEKPAWLGDVKPYKRDRLDPQWGQTDIVIQICSDDPVTTSYAMRHMVRSAADYADVTWVQTGFSHAHGTYEKGQTARNLFGQVDGTVNPHNEAEFDDQVWIDEGPDWAREGTAMVVRRIRMNLDTWEELDRGSREAAVGRTLDNGAPLTGEKERDQPDMSATDKYGLPVIDKNSHMARAMPPKDHPEQRLLRRPFSYDLPPDSRTPGHLSNAGLIFICFQKDPTKQFEPIQDRLDEADTLNTWITHIGSAMYFCPPGTKDGGGDRDAWWAESLVRTAEL